jgi:hypothetical protein
MRVGGEYARVEQTGKDKIFVVLAEFGNTEHSSYPDEDAEESGAQRVNGPLHNQIPRPDRSVDNSTLWKRDYTAATTRTCTSTGCATTTSTSPRGGTPSGAT